MYETAKVHKAEVCLLSWCNSGTRLLSADKVCGNFIDIELRSYSVLYNGIVSHWYSGSCQQHIHIHIPPTGFLGFILPLWLLQV